MNAVYYKKYLDKINRSQKEKTKRENFIRLDKNEKVSKISHKEINLFIKKIKSEDITSYPNPNEAYNKIAKLNELKISNILITSGADAAIKHCFEVYVKEKSEVISLNPTFAMLDIYVKIFNAKPNYVKVKLKNNKFSFNIQNLLLKITNKASLIYLPNPNSPDGSIVSLENIERIVSKAKKFKIPVLIDEAYIEFSKINHIGLIKKYNNLILCKTFSKMFGMAGLRIGYLVSNSNNIKILSKTKPMYEVNSLALKYLIFQLKNKKLYENYLNEVIKGKNFLIDILEKKNLTYINSHTNFIYIKFRKNKNSLLKIAKTNKILLGKIITVKKNENFVRVTVDNIKIMKKLISFINKYNKIFN